MPKRDEITGVELLRWMRGRPGASWVATISDIEKALNGIVCEDDPDRCPACGGVGRQIDTTYDRTGAEVECRPCFGSGKSADAIRRLLKAA